MLKIFYSVNHSGCAWWRARQPAAMLKKLGLAEVYVFDNTTTNKSELKEVIDWCDTVVAQCPAGVQSVAMICNYQELGKVVVVDYDDLVYSCSPFNPGYKTLGIKEVKTKELDGSEKWIWKDNENGFSLKDNWLRYRSHFDIFKVVDGITVTTDYLKNSYLNYIPECNGKIDVIPNSIDFNLYRPFPKKESSKVRIGWIASSSHINEIWLVKDIFEKLYKKYGDKIIFVQLGDVGQLAQKFDSSKMEFHQFVDLGVYPLKLASLNLDIGICPIVDDEFNNNKSPLKWSEYGALNIPSVCSDLPPYNCVEEGKTGLLAKTVDDWVDKLSMLIDDAKLRKDMGANAFQDNYENFNLEKNCKLWINAFEKYHQSVLTVGQQ
jgi:glycosyltransferase involved in cell wall biosynthesis